MCGIAGFIDSRCNASATDLATAATAMAATLRHRGPNSSGVWTDPAAGVAFAHRRLAVVDLSDAGHQPMMSSCGRWVLTFNGEIYNHAELREELRVLGRTFRGHSDSEVLVEAVATWGCETTLRRLSGMFAFAAWNRGTRTLTLARDRVGEKPLFWGRFGELFLFASELKALLAHPGWTPEIDQASLSAYTRWGHVPAPHCIYRGVGKLSPGELLVLHSGREPQVSRYWDPAQVVAAAQLNPLQISEADALDGLESLLGDAISRQMVADVPVGAFLSGGIDSSLIVALMRARSGRPVNTFTIAFEDKRYDEAAHARAVAKHLGTTHSELVVSSEDALALVPQLPYWFDEPLSIRSQIPIMMLCQLARRDVTVALSGDAGDELFGGYPGYYVVRAIHRATAGLSPAMRRLVASTADGLIGGAGALHRFIPGRAPAGTLGQQIEAGHCDRSSGRWYQRTLCPAVCHHGRRAPARRRNGRTSDALAVVRAPGRCRRPDRPHGLLRAARYFRRRDAGQSDRASMASSLEVRVPMLDHRVVEYAWRLPAALKSSNRAGSKPLLRQLLYRHVPRELVDRPKRGFSSALPVWMRWPSAGMGGRSFG